MAARPRAAMMAAAYTSLVYLVAIVLGGVVGVWLSGAFVRYVVSFDGTPAHRLTAEQAREIMVRNPNALEQSTSIVIAGNPVVTVSGQWLMWLVVIVPIIVAVALASVFKATPARAWLIALCLIHSLQRLAFT